MTAGEAYNAGEMQQQAMQDGIKRRTLQLAATYEAEIKPHFSGKGIDAWHWTLK